MKREFNISYSVFVADTLISDDILLAKELIHKTRYPIRGDNLVKKFDMAKIYDIE